ncbi:unnamed protein product, partial [Prunus brigantina]
MEGVVKVARVGLGGGLALFWRSGWDLRLLSSSVGHIHVLITESNGSQVYLTGFYGHPETQQRHHSWELLRRLSHTVQGAWMVMALEDCRLSSTSFTGYPFTWARSYPDGSMVEERLDRCVANGVFFDRYSHLTTNHLVAVGSDHYPILVEACVEDPEASAKRSRRFHFEEMWTKEPDFDKVIEEAWKVTDGVEGVRSSLSLCAKELKTWNHVHFGNVRNQLKYAYKELAALQGRLTTDQSVLKAKVEKTISELLEKQETMWRQRSRVAWLKEGDKNTRFFHGRASSRSKRNRVDGIFDENHVWQNDERRIGDLFCDYFKTLFSSSGSQQMERILNEVRPVITNAMNDQLLQPFTREELEHTLFQMFPTKAPGHDGMPALFFQKYWHIVGDKVANKCLQILNGEGSVREFNHTLIALIPKVKMPTTVSEFRPISLCTTVYKMIAKTIANRLKFVLPHVITENQSAFVPNRMILDNVMAAFEIMHTIKGVKKGHDVKMALKLDMAKAYDRVDILFMKATRDACMALETLFKIYEEVSGQQINYSKSAFSLSPNAITADYDMIAGVLHIPAVQCHEKYLGLPTIAGKGRKQLFQHLKDKLWKYINGWKEKLLSRAGKEILIKAVLQAIPTYSMSCFRIPKGLCKELNGIMARFWWAKAKDKRGIHWVKWEMLCKSKFAGGLGFRDLAAFNQALLAKQCWRIFQTPQSPVARIFRARYHPSVPFLEARVGTNPSFIWRSLHWGKELLNKGLRWRVGNGESIKVYTDKWLPVPSLFRIMSSPQLSLSTRFFIWRCVWDFLPCGQTLFNRKIVSTPICPNCHRKSESVLHAVWLCEAAKEVWRNSTWGNVCEVWRVNSFRELCSHIRHGCQASIPVPLHVWRPPTPGNYKINVDGALKVGDSVRGVGVVVRNEKGEFMAACGRRLQGSYGARQTEFMAAIEGLRFAIDMGFTNAILEMDANDCIQSILSTEECNGVDGLMIEEVKSLLNNFRAV